MPSRASSFPSTGTRSVPTLGALEDEASRLHSQIMHLFVSEAMLAATLYTHVKAGGAAPSQRMERSQILEELSFLSRLLQNEFVYGTEGLEVNANATIASLEVRPTATPAHRSIRVAKLTHLASSQKDQVILIEGSLIGLSPKERSIGRENFGARPCSRA